MGRNSKEYDRNYYNQVTRTKKLARRIAVESSLCGVCVLVPWTGHWGPLDIPVCDQCLGAMATASMEQQSHVLDLQRGTEALGQDYAWEGDKVVHIVEKGQGGVWGELGDLADLADLPGIKALCGVVSPPGPMRFDMIQPKELKKWPLCPACIEGYPDPPGLTENENNHFGYAMPATAALAPDTVTVTYSGFNAKN